MNAQKRQEIDHMYKALSKVKDLTDRLLSHRYFPEDPLEERVHLILQEKQENLDKLLPYLAKEDVPQYSDLVEWLDIIYRDDETEKLIFQGWKRICSQNKLLEEQTLQEMERMFNEMKEELEEALPVEEDFMKDAHIPYVVPTLYAEN
ncbi:hypothetical protein [Bacillus piscicola]|uniref:hypothetical protein n=1 Tax=Bacillus piscicola TaxID=1632684 RepID=UPI001F08D69A|nr:hypothetical protein [Bacillus piscicola]